MSPTKEIAFTVQVIKNESSLDVSTNTKFENNLGKL